MRTAIFSGLFIAFSLLLSCSGDEQPAHPDDTGSSIAALEAAQPSPQEFAARLAAARPIEQQSAAAKSSYAQARRLHRQRELDVARARIVALRELQGAVEDKTALAGVIKEAEAELSHVQKLETQQATGAR